MLALAIFFKFELIYILLSVEKRKRRKTFLLVFQPNQFAVELRTLVRHIIQQHVHIHEQLRDNLINGKSTVRALVRQQTD